MTLNYSVFRLIGRLAAVVFVAAATMGWAAERQAQRPNIVFILADDEHAV